MKSPAIAAFLILLINIAQLPEIAAESQSAGQDGSLTVTHRERSLQPGEVIILEVFSPRPVSQITVEAFGRQYPVRIEEGGLRATALLGIDVEMAPGAYGVRLTGIDSNGKAATAEESLIVSAKNFPTRRLKVEGKYVSPPARILERIKRERALVDAALSTISQDRLWQGAFRLPVSGAVISEFGKRSIYNGQPRGLHTGVDFRGKTGTPIRAPNAGKVVLVSSLYYSGRTVIIDHGHGLHSYFGHMSAFSVKEGDVVRTGQKIGTVGATGMVTGPHLHWTVRLAGTRVDPLSLVELSTQLSQ